ncbi:hypothetical protein SIN09_04675 [Streptomyces sp. F8]|uniref:hypothetical protein n=1 Tax=Streptomyces sp. F8 TaxID=1436085 RepID=UPI0029CC042B|nr:hypothetical protein [Streptomyces sp. F8]MDX6758753.1 hypothetical protein [Streptomyces sp. F8]
MANVVVPGQSLHPGFVITSRFEVPALNEPGTLPGATRWDSPMLGANLRFVVSTIRTGVVPSSGFSAPDGIPQP